MKGATKLLPLMMGFILLVSCGHPQYRPEDLAARDGKEIRGVVSKQGRGTFLLAGQDGVENKYCTGEMTQYLPEDYRSQEGDSVRVVFTESWENTGKLKRTVLQLEAVSIPEKNLARQEIAGEIVAVGRGSARHSRSISVKSPADAEALPIYIPFYTPVDTMLTANRDLVGKKVKVNLRRIPIYRGNGYIYEAAAAEWLRE